MGSNAHHTKKEHLDNLILNGNCIKKGIQQMSGNYDKINILVKEFEIKLFDFIVINNLSFLQGERIFDFIQNNITDINILKKASLNSHKISELARECFSPVILEILETKLSYTPFSILIDESSDNTKKKFCGIMVQHYDEIGKLKINLHSFVETSENQSSEALFQVIKKQILDKSFSKNLIGVSMDSTNVNKGWRKSISKSLHDYNENLCINFCLCHSCNLVIKFALSCIPNQVEKLIKGVYNYFNNSPKRTFQWLGLQEHMSLKPHKMLSYTKNRWLSLEACISRVLSKYDALIHYFESETKTDKAKRILKLLQAKENKIYLQFIKIFIEKIDSYNLKFQKNEPVCYHVAITTKEFFVSIINMILKSEYRLLSIPQKIALVQRKKEKIDGTKIDEITIDPMYLRSSEQFISHFLSLYKSIEWNLLGDDNNNMKEEISQNIIRFIKRIVWKIIDLFPLQNILFDYISHLDPANFDLEPIAQLGKRFQNIISDDKYYLFYEELERMEINLASIQ